MPNNGPPDGYHEVPAPAASVGPPSGYHEVPAPQQAAAPSPQQSPSGGMLSGLMSAMPAIKQGVSDIGSGISQGVRNIFSAPMIAIDPETTIKNMGTEAQGLQQQARQDLSSGNYVKGAGEALYGTVPGVGPWLYNILSNPSLKGMTEAATTLGGGALMGGEGAPDLNDLSRRGAADEAIKQIKQDEYTRGLGVSAKLKQARDTLHQQEGQMAQSLISKVDGAHPEGAVDARATMTRLHELEAKVQTPENPKLLADLYDNSLLSQSGNWTVATAIQMKTKIGAAMQNAKGVMKSVLTGVYDQLDTQIGKAARSNGALEEFAGYKDLSRKRFNIFDKDPIISKIINTDQPTAGNTLGKLSADNMPHIENVLSQFKGLGIDPDELRSEGEFYDKAEKMGAAKGFRYWPWGTVGGIAGRVSGVGTLPGILGGLAAERVFGGTGKVLDMAKESSDSPFYDLGKQRAVALEQGYKHIPPSKVTLKAAQNSKP